MQIILAHEVFSHLQNVLEVGVVRLGRKDAAPYSPRSQ